MWSSALRVPLRAVSIVQPALSAAVSGCTAKRMTWFCWSDHITPTLPAKATIEEMSSALMTLSETGTRKGAVHVVSLVVEWATHTWSSELSAGFGFVNVTHSRPRLSRVMVTDSMLPAATDLGKPLSIVYLSVDA